MEAADQRGDDVAVFGMIIVAAAVEIGRHHVDEVGAVLAAIGLDHLDAGDLGDRIGLVGRLQRPGQHGILAHRLRRQLRIDAGRAEEHQLLDAVDVRGVDHVRRDRQIVVEEFGAQRVVGDDAADLRRRQKHHLRALGRRTIDRPRPGRADRPRCASTVSSSTSSRASRRTSAEPTMPRWPATKTVLPFSSNGMSCHWRPPAWRSRDRPPPFP